MDQPFGMGGALRLALPDRTIEITPQTSQEERQKILDDLRSRYPDMLAQAPELEGMIMGTDRPPVELMFEDISTPEKQRKAVEEMRTAMPELMRQDPRIERALMGDQQAMDELIAEGGSFSAPTAPLPTADPAAPVDSAPLPSGPVSERKGFFARLLGR